MNLPDALGRLSRYMQAVIVTRDGEGHPYSVATDFEVSGETVILRPPKTGPVSIQTTDVHVVFSRIRPLPGYGYDERSYVELAGDLAPDGSWRFIPMRARGWDEADLPFFELCERALPQARRYMEEVGQAQGTKVKPRMSAGWKFFVATRLPFLTATLVPVFLGIAVAAYERRFSWPLMALTLVGAIAVHLGLNIANDIFDARSGADEVNLNPTMFSGGSRAIQYGLLTMRQMVTLSVVCYSVAIACGLVLTWKSGLGLLWVGLAGILISVFYTAPPFRLVHRGLGELSVALGFGPIMVLGAYYVQTGHYALRPLLLSVPVAVFVMLILYANEIPDRVADAKAGKRTLVVRWTPDAVIARYALSAAVAYVVLIAGNVFGVLPRPTLIGLLTIPLAWYVARGLKKHFFSPYGVVPALQSNILLHLATGILLIAGVLVAKVVA